MMRNGRLVLVVALAGIAALIYLGRPVSAQSGPSLGMAQSFAILGGSSVTVASTGSVITGDVGVSPGTSITGFPAGGVIQPPFSLHANDTAAINAQSSVNSLYTTLQGMGPATPLGPELGSTGVGPGIYSFSSTANIAAGTVFTLSGAGTYIFKVGTSVTANVGSSMSLLAGASPCNVFWQVNNAATVNGGVFAGTIVAQDAVTIGSGGRLDGRALTTSLGSVTLAGGNIVGGCSTPTGGCPTITLSPSTLPNAAVGAVYNQAIVASGGAGPYTYAVTAGALPAGLVLNAATGVLTGTPTSAGPATFTVTATDANGCAGSVTYTISVAACPVITVAPLAVPPGRVGVAYSQLLTATGGTGTYVFTVLSGTLPAGLTLSAGGLLAGTPTAVGSSTVTIRVTDGNGCPATIIYTILVTPTACPVITLAPTTMPIGRVGVAYSQQITASGGTGPYVFTVVTGTLPAGLTLSSAGLLSGTPTSAGSSTTTIRATDGNSCPGDVVYTIVVAPAACPVITLTPPTMPAGAVGVAYRQQMTATGGTGSPVFTVVTGTLPAGLTLSPGGLLSGTPTTVGSSTVMIQAIDGTGCPGVITYTISITTAVPTLPQAFVVLLALGLTGVGYVRLRRQARG